MFKLPPIGSELRAQMDMSEIARILDPANASRIEPVNRAFPRYRLKVRSERACGFRFIARDVATGRPCFYSIGPRGGIKLLWKF